MDPTRMAADRLLVEIAGLILGAADLAAEEEDALPPFDRGPAGHCLELYLLASDAASLVPTDVPVRARTVSGDVWQQLKAAEGLTRLAVLSDCPPGLVEIIRRLDDEIRERRP